MGLDYLNKKVWHPGSMKNIQKVWQVEQVQKQINKKRREREKKLLQEQHNDQLKRIQVQAGLIPRSHLDRMEWMYDWGNKIGQQKTNEEFLTGKKVATPGENKESRHVFQEEITNRKCEDFQLLHEDPMFEIMKHEKAKRDAIVNNPIQMRNIIKEVEKEYLPEDLEERRKMRMSSIRRRSTSSSNSSSSSSQRQRRKKHRKDKHKHKHKNRRQRNESEERSRSREQSKKTYKQSKLFKDYIKDRFGGITKQDQNGNLKPDYSMHKKKYKTQIQLDEEDRRIRLEKMRENAKKLQALRQGTRKRSESEEQPRDYEGGVAKIRGEMLNVVKENRNHRRYKGSDED